MVLCCDEKTQIQALERTQRGLPLGIGHIRTQTHDYRRHGTITLFAAMNYLDGKLIKRLEAKHTHVEWLRFLKQIDRETPKELTIHVIADNYATHKHEKVRAWLARHPRFRMHFTPTSSSWLNLVERFFADLTAVIRDGSFASLGELRWHLAPRKCLAEEAAMRSSRNPGESLQLVSCVAGSYSAHGTGSQRCANSTAGAATADPAQGKPNTNRLFPALGRSSGVSPVKCDDVPPEPVLTATNCCPSTA